MEVSMTESTQTAQDTKDQNMFEKVKNWWKKSDSAGFAVLCILGVVLYTQGGDLTIFMLFLLLACIAIMLRDIRSTLRLINYRLLEYGGVIPGLDDSQDSSEG